MGNELAQRAAQKAASDRRSPEQKQADERGAQLGALLRQQKAEIARALPAGMDADRLTRIGLTVFRKTPDLQNCDPLSIVGALMTCAQLGLEPGPLGHAYLVPFQRECTFILGYRGMVDLVRRSGKIAKISPGIVYQRELDEGRFRIFGGSDERIEHEPIIFEDAGPAVGWYVIVKLTSGEQQGIALSRAKVEKFRQRSKMPNSPAWRNDYDPMAQKTCFRRLFAWLPASIEVAQALGQDEQVRRDITPDALDAAPSFPELPAGTSAADGAEPPIDGEIVPDDAATGPA